MKPWHTALIGGLLLIVSLPVFVPEAAACVTSSDDKDEDLFDYDVSLSCGGGGAGHACVIYPYDLPNGLPAFGELCADAWSNAVPRDCSPHNPPEYSECDIYLIGGGPGSDTLMAGGVGSGGNSCSWGFTPPRTCTIPHNDYLGPAEPGNSADATWYEAIVVAAAWNQVGAATSPAVAACDWYAKTNTCEPRS